MAGEGKHREGDTLAPMDGLEPVRCFELPLSEISGLGVRSRPGGVELVAVGDEEFAVVTASVDRDGTLGDADRHDLASALPEDITAGVGGSEFESVACDSAGTLLVLQEEPPRVLVINPLVDRLLQTINLVVEPTQALFGAAWAEDPNKRGEALVALQEGHLLVVKQRNPVVLIEFAPSADPHPRGLTPDTLGPPVEFPVGEGEHDYLVVATWELPAEPTLESVNDAAVGEDGRLYVLSSNSERIARLGPVQPGEDSVPIEAAWDVDLSDRANQPEPKDTQKKKGHHKGGDRPHPEGLVLLEGLLPIIAIDKKDPGPNVYVLESPGP